jgi:ketosteroid isomerase-like protein
MLLRQSARSGKNGLGIGMREKLDAVVAAYAEDAVYLPPHHEYAHGRDSIRQHLKAPLSHSVCGLTFDVIYMQQPGLIAWMWEPTELPFLE